MIEDLTISKIKEMLWAEVMIPAFGHDGISPGDHSHTMAELGREFIIRHRLRMEDVMDAHKSLLEERRELPNGLLLVPNPLGHNAGVPMGSLYEGLDNTGALQPARREQPDELMLFWEEYQRTGDIKDLTRYLKHRAYVVLFGTS